MEDLSGQAELRPAKINDRFIAYLIDAAPFGAGYAACSFWLLGSFQVDPRLGAAWIALCLAYQFAGNLLGGTVGKRLMGLAVLRRDGRALGLWGSALRALGYGLSTPLFNFGFLIALIHPESRALHDMISGSLVVEARPKAPAETGLLFLAALGTLTFMVGGSLYLQWNKPTRSDRAAVERARLGLEVLAQVEEAYKTQRGVYSSSLAELAQASGDVETFRSALAELYDPHLFRIQAGSRAYRISAVARDRRQTRLTVEGPPARFVP
ncbi:MAG: RDD family protein [Elusimicrobia bacterium]|nr:RDD family protein [Elusimicrobiota bacterium]